MINSKKKGFTIVELVIVVAVIAVLAAVLIPTFSNLVKKANMSADQQAVKQMNTVLAIADAEKELETFEDAAKALDAAGYNALDSLIPLTTDYKFYWLNEKDCIVLVNKDLNVVFPENLVDFDITSAISKGEADNLKKGYLTDTSSSENIVKALSKGQSVKLTADVNLGATEKLVIPAGEEVVIDLNGKTINIDYRDASTHNQAIDNQGTLTIKGNGVINSRGINNSGILVIEEGVTINALDNNGGACVWGFAGSTTIINGGIFNVTNGSGDTPRVYPVAVHVAAGAKMEINGGTFTSNSYTYDFYVLGELVINDCEVNSWRGCLTAQTGANVTINGGTFTAQGNYGAWVLVAPGGTININGGTFVNSTNANQISTNETEEGKGTIVDNR